MIITFIQNHPLFCYAFGSVLALEVWDAAGGTNQLGTGDYWPR